MARYIDADDLLNALKEERKKGNFVFTSKWIKEIMDDLPTADVVPKSEVATSVINDLLDLLHSSIGDIKMSPDTTYQIVYLYAKEIEKKYTKGGE